MKKRLRAGLRVSFRLGLLVGVLYGIAGFLTLRLAPAPSVRLDANGAATVRALDPAAAEVSAWIETLGPEVRGALSVHSGRSGDSEGTFDEIGEAAARAGLDFVVLGDHPGEWLDEPGAFDPVRSAGALLVPGQELVIADAGRVLAVGLAQDTLVRRWEGSVAQLAARIDAVGGFVSVVHARSPRGRERWQAGLDAPGIHAWESLDVSEMARLRLADRWVGYHLVSFLSGLVVGAAQGPVLRLNREGTSAPGLLAYDSARARQPLVLTAGLNHHPKARIAGRLIPPYTPFFRTFTNHVRLRGTLPADAWDARAQLLEGLRRGHVFVSIGDAAEAAGFAFEATPDALGETASSASGGGLRLRLPPQASGGLLVRLLKDGEELGWWAGEPGQAFAVEPSGAGVYRVEVARAGIPLGRWRYGLRPWILSNAVVVGGAPP
ncbi:MAG: hypothetical protein HKO98_05750 [Gemmatimonadetes bacterium]|nr:hypothetical protein [Gemmatimonadota bacterium]